MKYFLTPFFLFLYFFSSAQNYIPFNSDVSKRFVNPLNESENDYFFYSTSDTIVGDTIIFNQYYSLQFGEYSDYPECGFWGGGGDPKLDTTWLGNQIFYNQNTEHLTIKNEISQNLVFNFGIALKDSSMFFETDSINYYIKYDALSVEDIFGQTDNVKHFKILTYNQNGDSINTALTGFEILLGEDLGLISFINCYYFPDILNVVELMGQTNPLIGVYMLTYGDAFPWQIGDVIQYRGHRSYPGENYSKITYETMTVTLREETIDSVWIFYDSDIHIISNPGGPPISSVFIPLPNPIAYRKNEFIIKTPHNYARRFEYPSGVFYYEGTENNCFGHNRLRIIEEFVSYCDSCRCYGAGDGFGSSVKRKYFVQNQGYTFLGSTDYGPPWEADNWSVSQIYSSINGVECGTEWVVGINEYEKDLMEIFPNPSDGNFTITLPSQPKFLFVTDMKGREVYRRNNLKAGFEKINLESVSPGCYIIHVQFNDEITHRQQIILQ
jgi:hypothetical protein